MRLILRNQKEEAIRVMMKMMMKMKMKNMEVEMNLMMTIMERNSWRRKYQEIPLQRNQLVVRREVVNQKVKLKKMLKKLKKKLLLLLILRRQELLKHLKMKQMMWRKKLKVPLQLLLYQRVREWLELALEDCLLNTKYFNRRLKNINPQRKRKKLITKLVKLHKQLNKAQKRAENMKRMEKGIHLLILQAETTK